MSTQSAFGSIPSELFIAIISYLSVKDIGSLSLASKPFRRLTIVQLFRNIKLNPESILAFQSGGRLSNIGSRVEQLVLDTANSGVRGPNDICTFTRSCIENTDLDAAFPNVKGIKLVFSPEMSSPSGSFLMDQRILRSTLLGFSKFSFYEKLRSLVFEVDTFGGGALDSNIRFDANNYYRLSPENWGFVGTLGWGFDDEYSYDLPDAWRDIDGNAAKLFPISLKELGLVTPFRPRYCNFIADAIGPGILRAIIPISKNLEKLEVLAIPPFILFSLAAPVAPIFPESEDVVYENVREFRLGIDTERYHERLEEAVRRVPNVEKFELVCSTAIGFHISARRDQPSIRFAQMAVLSKLKKVSIEAPMRDEIENLETVARRGPRNESLPAGKLTISAVIEAVTFWLRSGMDRLETVEFRLYFIPKNRLNDILEMLELWCDVLRDERGNWRLEWRSLRRNFENGKVEKGRFGSGMGFDREVYLETGES
ncbi:hypothetical protein AOL_s00076g101 [Orbilia oligospora ATCC 24927]|uniref:F-box domain-containing protein n=1 Tax=Arthrobotrys oligospora (strain ATCC 24927 / CBS 115.81 / DSM 1491) TaxID=756982 RepID=G1X8Z4_ARTOA|nr:hypothetical protein AOL_s00076g101 [Orbilia oligospora ATCC 24927]EGX50337.1 hypothetical protein AOL_s00076g101 [Orbilia oligospora ATCC 24927]